MFPALLLSRLVLESFWLMTFARLPLCGILATAVRRSSISEQLFFCLYHIHKHDPADFSPNQELPLGFLFYA
jgi:hypothetical protein